ncbi:MAG: STAS domain-containing protein [Actinomycetota bacterium]
MFVDLDMETSTYRGWSVISVAGELDLHSSPELTDAISGALEADHPHVGIDLTRVSFMDSTALGVLVSSLKRARERGGDLALIGAGGSPLKVLSLTGMADGVFPMVATAEDLDAR